MASTNPSPPPRTQSQIEADLVATRSRLTSSIEALIDQVHPNRIKQRTVATVKQRASDEVENAKTLVFNARGDLRTNRLIAIAGATAGLVMFWMIVRRLRGRRA